MESAVQYSTKQYDYCTYVSEALPAAGEVLHLHGLAVHLYGGGDLVVARTYLISLYIVIIHSFQNRL